MFHFTQRPRILWVVIGVLALVLVSETIVIGASTIHAGRAVTAIKVVTEEISASTSSTDYSTVPKMVLTLSVPNNQKAVFLATFSSYASGFCVVRGMVNGAVMAPSAAIFAAGGQTSPSSSTQFIAGPYPAGQYTITIQYENGGPGNTCWLGARTLSVLRSIS
jgi:hypothetical protein